MVPRPRRQRGRAALKIAHTMITPASVADPNGVRVRCAGPLDALCSVPASQVSAKIPQHVCNARDGEQVPLRLCHRRQGSRDVTLIRAARSRDAA